MKDKFKSIPKGERKNILLLCDDIRMHSGIATMAREFVIGTSHHFNWFNVGAAVKHPDAGKTFDLSADINKQSLIDDADVKVMPYNGYGDATLVRSLLAQKEFDAVLIFTDPRYWVWLFEIEREIRSKIPIMWLNIWDELPAPMYNKAYYNSVDVLMSISKQTRNINKMVLGDDAKDKLIEYVPHGINEETFFPITSDHYLHKDLAEFKQKTIPVEELEFTVFFNSRNINRKRPADLILAFDKFCKDIGIDKAKKCALVMHTAASDPNGTDLKAVKSALTGTGTNIFFSQSKISPAQMNLLYNMADVTVLPSSNEGWGLSLTESMMAGTMIIANTTGGMQDQMRFVDDDGQWIDFDEDFPSNHLGTYQEHGEWSIPVFPSNITLTGSIPTPYIFDSKCSIDDLQEAILKAYKLGKEKRDKRGLAGREWVTSDEAQMSASNMCKNIINTIDKGLESFKPRNKVDIIKVVERKEDNVTHKLLDY